MSPESPLDDLGDRIGNDKVGGDNVEVVSGGELNSWRRGFTPQAEIWNGRLAMLGLSAGLAVLLLSRLVSGWLS